MNTLGLSKPTWAASPSRRIKTCHSLLGRPWDCSQGWQTRPVSGLGGWGSAGSHTPQKSCSEKEARPHPARRAATPESLGMPKPGPHAAPAPTAAFECSNASRQVQPGRVRTGGPPLESPSLAAQRQQHLLGPQVPRGNTLPLYSLLKSPPLRPPSRASWGSRAPCAPHGSHPTRVELPALEGPPPGVPTHRQLLAQL